MFFKNQDNDGRAPISTTSCTQPYICVGVTITLCRPVLFRDNSIYSDDHMKSHKTKNIYFFFSFFSFFFFLNYLKCQCHYSGLVNVSPGPQCSFSCCFSLQSNNQGLICAWDVINDLVRLIHSSILVSENQDSESLLWIMLLFNLL